jgi:hypothetical protein
MLEQLRFREAIASPVAALSDTRCCPKPGQTPARSADRVSESSYLSITYRDQPLAYGSPLHATPHDLMGQSASELVRVTLGTGGNITSATPAAATIV